MRKIFRNRGNPDQTAAVGGVADFQRYSTRSDPAVRRLT